MKNNSIYQVARILLENNGLEYFYKKPNELTKEELEQIVGLVASGGEVMLSSIRTGIKSAALIAFVKDGDAVVATASIKNPSEFYKDDVFYKAGAEKLSEKYKFEYGYTFTGPAYRSRGIVKVITGELLRRDGKPVHATMREKNLAIIKILEGLGMKRLGDPYPSSRGNYNLIIMGNK